MPNTHETLRGLFSDIADAIRAKTGEAGTIIVDQFPDAIAAISTGLEVSLDRIYADPLPSKLSYAVGEVFDPTGMVLKADFTIDGVSFPGAVVSNYSYPTEPLTQEDTVAVISLTVGDVTKTLDISIGVAEQLTVTIVSKCSSAGEYGTFAYTVGHTGAVLTNMQYKKKTSTSYTNVAKGYFIVHDDGTATFHGSTDSISSSDAWRLVFTIGSRTVYLPFSPKVAGETFSVYV